MQQIAQQKREAFALTGHGQKSLIKTTSGKLGEITIISTGMGGGKVPGQRLPHKSLIGQSRKSYPIRALSYCHSGVTVMDDSTMLKVVQKKQRNIKTRRDALARSTLPQKPQSELQQTSILPITANPLDFRPKTQKLPCLFPKSPGHEIATPINHIDSGHSRTTQALRQIVGPRRLQLCSRRRVSQAVRKVGGRCRPCAISATPE